MSDAEVKEYRAQLEAVRQQILDELVGLERHELRYAADHPRYFTVRRALLRFGTHLREHTTQLVAARESIGETQSMPQRILARAEEAHGELLGTIIGLADQDLDRVPEPGEWTSRQILEHVIQTQEWLLKLIQEARVKAEPVESD